MKPAIGRRAATAFLLMMVQAASVPAQQPQPTPTPDAKHWLNTDSDVRHNASCVYFKKTKAGRPCKPDEGKACKICGG